MADKLEFQAEVSKLLDIVVNSLYSEKQIFLRELISNASDACDKLKYLILSNPDIAKGNGALKIKITPDAKENTLMVSDNGIGMNKDDLINHLGTIAKSGTAEFVRNVKDNGSGVELIGQFGVGFYAAFMVADKVEIVTKKAGETQAWKWVSDGKNGFEITEAERDGNGTDIKLFLKEDDKKLTTEFNEGEEVVAPPPKKRGRRIILNILLVAVIALGILSLIGIVGEINQGSGSSFTEVISGASPLFCVVLLAVVLAVMALDVLKYCIISKTVTGKFMVRASLKTNLIGKYYDAVTPFSTGGQPMQIYYLNSKGISGGNATAIVLIRYFASIICWIILGGALMIAGSVKGVLNGVSGGSILKITGWVGIGVNLIAPAFVTLFLFLPKLMGKITVGVVKLGHKMKIVKDVEKTTAQAMKIVNDFKNSFKLMATSPFKLIVLVLVCFAESALVFSIPYFVMKAFSCNLNGLFLNVVSLNVFTIFGVSFIPTPGNSGVVEGMGALAFSVAAGESLIWSVICWRFAVFYIYIIIGLFITVYDIIAKNIKIKKSLRRTQ